MGELNECWKGTWLAVATLEMRAVGRAFEAPPNDPGGTGVMGEAVRNMGLYNAGTRQWLSRGSLPP